MNGTRAIRWAMVLALTVAATVDVVASTLRIPGISSSPFNPLAIF